MLLHPENYATTLSGVVKGDIQPNAVDIRLNRVWRLDESSMMTLTDDEKIHARRFEVVTDNEDFYLLPRGTYEISFVNQIIVAEGEAGWVITRSTLNRNGNFITSGLYDSGYGSETNGAPMAACLHVKTPLKVKKGTRVGQYICVSSETAGLLYSGDYGNGGHHDAHLNS